MEQRLLQELIKSRHTYVLNKHIQPLTATKSSEMPYVIGKREGFLAGLDAAIATLTGLLAKKDIDEDL